MSESIGYTWYKKAYPKKQYDEKLKVPGYYETGDKNDNGGVLAFVSYDPPTGAQECNFLEAEDFEKRRNERQGRNKTIDK